MQPSGLGLILDSSLLMTTPGTEILKSLAIYYMPFN
jgi:hypothetical protein